MSTFLAEIIGTAILIILGDGVVANVVLNRTKGEASGWIVITTGWFLAVFFGVFAVGSISGAHINPAVSFGLWVDTLLGGPSNFGLNQMLLYWAAQMIGAFIGAVIVWLAYLPHWSATDNADLKLAVFSTAPAIRSYGANFVTEVIGTFMLLLAVFTIKAPFLTAPNSPTPEFSLNLGALGAAPIAMVVWAIGLSLGGPTGYAINPARDLGPRIAHAILPIPGKRDSDWGYAWVPVVAPLVGAALAAVVWALFGRW